MFPQNISRLLKSAVRTCKCRVYSTQPASSGLNVPALSKKKPKVVLVDDEDKPIPIESRAIVKGLFLNKIDPKMMVFPELPDVEDVEELATLGENLDQLFDQKVNSIEIDQSCKIPSDILDNLKSLGVYGLCVPREYGGLGLSYRAYVRACESIGRDLSIFSSWYIHHDLACWIIAAHGTEQQKLKYLPHLASGKITAALCLHEEASGQDISAIESKTKWLEGEGVFGKLNGTKTWVTNGDFADLLIVFAKETAVLTSEAFENDINLTSVYLVDRRDAGDTVKLLKRRNTAGLKGLQVWDLEFKDTVIHRDSVLGTQGNGFEMALEMMEARPFGLGAAVVSLCKQIVGLLCDRCNNTERYGKMLSEHPAMQKRISDMCTEIFKLESLTYYVAGLLDESPDYDMTIEGLIINRQAKGLLRTCVISAMQAMGASSSEQQNILERLLRDAATLSSFLTGEDAQSYMIAMAGLQTWGSEWANEQSRNPLKFPLFKAKNRLRSIYGSIDQPNIKHFVFETVHPSLEAACRSFELSLSRMEILIFQLLETYGTSIEDEFLILEQISDMVSRLFSMMCAISRTSRSYSIGLPYADDELDLTHTLCQKEDRNLVRISHDLVDVSILGMENKLTRHLGKHALEDGGYKITWPLFRTY